MDKTKENFVNAIFWGQKVFTIVHNMLTLITHTLLLFWTKQQSFTSSFNQANNKDRTFIGTIVTKRLRNIETLAKVYTKFTFWFSIDFVLWAFFIIFTILYFHFDLQSKFTGLSFYSMMLLVPFFKIQPKHWEGRKCTNSELQIYAVAGGRLEANVKVTMFCGL